MVAWGSFSDWGVYHGWLMAFDPATLKLMAVFNPTPQFQSYDSASGPSDYGGGGAFWQGGAAPATDGAGNIYINAADGSFNADKGGNNYGDSLLKLRLNGNSFQEFMIGEDTCSDSTTGDVAEGPDWDRLYGTPSYWNGKLYAAPSSLQLRQYRFANGLLNPTPVATSPSAYGLRGANTVVSAQGNQNGILWAYEKSATGQGILHAYDANSVSKELWNSNMNAGRDALGTGIGSATPVVAEGRVYSASETGDRRQPRGRRQHHFVLGEGVAQGAQRRHGGEQVAQLERSEGDDHRSVAHCFRATTSLPTGRSAAPALHIRMVAATRTRPRPPRFRAG